MLGLTKAQILGILKIWLPLAIVTTALSGLIFLVVQQDLRIGGNDPQIQIAEDVAAQISSGQNPLAFIPPIKVEISKSLANYIIIFDANGKIIGSSAVLDGKAPTLPPGVLDKTKSNGETRFTWQPRTGVRSAVVIDYFKGPTNGYVMVGRSLREIENREDNTQLIVFLAWIITMATSLAAAAYLSKLK
jgi:hypothetical protein